MKVLVLVRRCQARFPSQIRVGSRARPLCDGRSSKPLHQKPSTPEAMQTKEFFQQKHFTQDDFHKRRCQTALHQKKFTPDSEIHQEPSTQENLQHEGTVCTHLYTKDFYTRRLLHQNPFTPQGPCIHQKTLAQETVYTKNLYAGLLHRRQFEPNSFDAKMLLHQTAFPH